MALAGLLLFPVSISGIAWLLRATESRPWRPPGLAIVLQLGLMLLIGGKSYYSAGYIPLAIAAGSYCSAAHSWAGSAGGAWSSL